MGDYLTQISELPRLDAEREAELGRKAAAGCERSRTRLVEANLWVAVPMAKAMCRKAGGKWEASDLMAEAAIGLMQAADRWDPSRGVRFGAYARMRVRGAMRDFLKKRADTVRGAGDGQALSLDAGDEAEDSPGAMLDRLAAPELPEADVDLSNLSRAERAVVTRRLLAPDRPESFETLADELGVTVEHLRRAQGRALRKLRAELAA